MGDIGSRGHAVLSIRRFLGIANYMRRFILAYSTIVLPLSALTNTTPTSGSLDAMKPASKKI